MWAGRAVLVASLIGFCSCATQDTAVKTPAAPQSGLAKGSPAGSGEATASQDLAEKPDPAVWAAATNLFEAGKYEECIVFCRENATVEALFLIVDCYAKLRQKENAVQQLYEIEAFFPVYTVRARLKIIKVYDALGYRSLCMAEKRAFIRKYPSHPEAKRFEWEVPIEAYSDDIDNNRRLIREQNGASFSDGR